MRRIILYGTRIAQRTVPLIARRYINGFAATKVGHQSLEDDNYTNRKFNTHLITLAAQEKYHEIFEAVKTKTLTDPTFSPDFNTYRQLAIASAKLKRPEYALKALERMKEIDSTQVSVLDYTSCITAFARTGRFDEVNKLLKEMNEKNLPPNVVTYTSLIQAYCDYKQPLKALQLLDEMKKANIMPNTYTLNILMHAFGKLGDPARALAFFNQLKEMLHPAMPSEDSYSVIIYVLSRNGRGNQAWELWREYRAHQQPSPMLYNSVLAYCAHYRQLDKALELYEEMKRLSIPRDIATYAALFDTLAHVKQFNTAIEIYREIKGPDVSTKLDWRTYYRLLELCAMFPNESCHWLPIIVSDMIQDGICNGRLKELLRSCPDGKRLAEQLANAVPEAPRRNKNILR